MLTSLSFSIASFNLRTSLKASETGAIAIATLIFSEQYDAQKAVVHPTQVQESDAYIS
jgi:hypothetical protein